MKNRVLALCLTVALLLGMMPAITMPTRAEAVAADVNVDAVFTQETITVDGNLTETSWKNATYYDIAKDSVSGSLAVVVNAGDVYVALKGNATSVSAAIGGKSATGTTVSGVTELCVPDVTIGSFGATLVMTLTVDGTAITAAVTFTQKEINLNIASDAGTTFTPNMSAASAGNAGTGYANWVAASARYGWSIQSASKHLFWGVSDRTDRNNGAAFEVDHSKQVIWTQNITFYSHNMYLSTYATAGYDNLVIIDTNQNLSANNGMLYRMNDGGENGGFFYVVLYAELEEGQTNACAKARFIMPGSCYGNVIYSDPITLSGTAKTLSIFGPITFQWDPDGSVTVTAKDTYNGNTVMSGTVEGATWTRDTTAAQGTISNPESVDWVTYDPDGDGTNSQYRTTGDFMDFYWRMAGHDNATTAHFYQYQPTVTHKDAVVAIADGNYLAGVTVPNVVEGNLPATVAHTYLGNLPLTWTVVDGIVAADGTVTHPLEDTVVTLNAVQGDTPIVTNQSVTVKGAEKLASLYTAETMAADNALTETSWKRSAWYAFGDNALSGSAAVVIKHGTAYIAVKSATATSGTVTLAGKEAALTFANGVAEVAIADLGLTKYESSLLLELSVTDGVNTANAICVAAFTNKAVNLTEGTPLVLKVNGTGSGSANMGNTTHNAYRSWSFSSSKFNYYYMLDTVSATDATPSGFSLDHSKEVNLEFNVRFEAPIPDGDSELITALREDSDTSYGKSLTFLVNDSDAENGGFFYAMYYHLTDGDGVTTAYIRFMMPTSTAAQPVFSDPIALYTHVNSKVFRIGFVWNPDGSVAVTYSGTMNSAAAPDTSTYGDGTVTVVGKVDGATWKHTGSAGTYKNPKSFAGTSGDYFQHSIGTNSTTAITGYFWNNMELTHTDIATELDINDGLSGDLIPDVVTDDMPSSVDHAYLGKLNLKWSADVENILSESGAIRLPEVDTTVTITAAVGSDEIAKKTVTVKAAEKLAALATAEAMAADGKLYEASWRYAAWKAIGGNVPGSVAVLMKGGEAYVAIQSATATSATVTLGETTLENVPFVDGAVEIKIADASIDTLQETLAVAVALTDGTNTSTLKSNFVVLDKQKVSNGRTGEVIAFVNTHEAGDSGDDVTYRNGTHFTASSAEFWKNNRLARTQFYVLNSSHGLAWDHKKDIYIEQNLWTNLMPVSDGMFTDTGSALTYSDGLRVHGQDYVSDATNYAFWANIYNADAEGNLKVRFLKADKTNSDPIDLGITVSDANGAACVGFLWSKDGSITVLVNGEAKGIVADATITTAKGYLAANTGDRFYPSLQSASAAYMYIYDFSVTHVAEDAASVLTQQVALGENIGFTFKGDNVSATIGGNTYSGSEVTVNLAAAQMNDAVTVTVNDNSGLTYTQSYNVRDYAMTVLGSNDYAAYHDMVKAMLHYGAAAQAHFGYDAEYPVNAGIGDLGDVTVPGKLTVGKDGTCPEGIAYYGTSLIFRNKIVIRFYFELADGYDIANYTFTDKNGKPFEVMRDGQSNLYYMDAENINPQQYDDIYTVTVGEYTVSYSCLHYITRMYHNNVGNAEKATLVALMKAMYAYHTAAETLLGDNVQ